MGCGGPGVWTGALRDEVAAVVRVVVIAGRGACRDIVGCWGLGWVSPGGQDLFS